MPIPREKLSVALGRVDPAWVDAVQRINAVMGLKLVPYAWYLRETPSLIRDLAPRSGCRRRRVVDFYDAAWEIAEHLLEQHGDDGLGDLLESCTDEMAAVDEHYADWPEDGFVHFMMARLVDCDAQREWPALNAAFSAWLAEDPALAMALVRVRQIGQRYKDQMRLAR